MKSVLLPKTKFDYERIRLQSSPVTFFEKVYGKDRYGFIYESLESLGERGRYSCVGARPLAIFKSRGSEIEIVHSGKAYRQNSDAFTFLRNIIYESKVYPKFSIFNGGAVGYIAYDAVRFFEDIPDKNPDELNIPELYFIFPSEIIIFDHREKVVDIMIYNGSNKRMVELKNILKTPEKETVIPHVVRPVLFEANFTKDSFCKIVGRAKEYICAGDVFQVVPSQRFKFAVRKKPLSIYKALRITNPSPYMYYLKLDGLFILGSSPETLVKLVNGQATSRPIAGTRPRGKDEKHDQSLEADLLCDEKELAEHVMLVDLARNDIGRVCECGTVTVEDFMKIEKYSKVMHITSNVIGTIQQGRDAFDLLRAVFPAGTVSGAPKIRAMQIIDELETVKRGIYAGAIGYFGFDGNMDLCIAIRTIVMKDDVAYVQGGAGIVADSIPEREYEETLNKVSALRKAIEMAR